MRIDAHHHLWSLARGDYGWLDPVADPSLSPIARDFGVDEYAAIAKANGIHGSIVVQAAPTVAETGWLLAQAARSEGLVLGVVGWIDLEAADAGLQVAGLAADPLLVGLRPMLQDLEDPGWIGRDALAPALEALVEHGLVLDLLVRSAHLPAALAVLQRNAGLRAVVDHGAKPAIAASEWAPWADGMRRIASETGAFCKFSGLLTEAAPGAGGTDLRRYADHLLECFGPRRLIWGSDWPVLTLAAPYAEWLRITGLLLETLGAEDRDLVMGESALACYRPRTHPAFRSRD